VCHGASRVNGSGGAAGAVRQIGAEPGGRPAGEEQQGAGAVCQKGTELGGCGRRGGAAGAGK
jgi:hypothetical protein